MKKKANYLFTFEPNLVLEALHNRSINIMCKWHLATLELHRTIESTSSPNPSNKQKLKLIPHILFIKTKSCHMHTTAQLLPWMMKDKVVNFTNAINMDIPHTIKYTSTLSPRHNPIIGSNMKQNCCQFNLSTLTSLSKGFGEFFL